MGLENGEWLMVLLGMGIMILLGMGMMSPFGMGMMNHMEWGFYDPFWNPGFGFNRGASGFRPGSILSRNWDLVWKFL